MTEQNEQQKTPATAEQLVLNSPDEAKSVKDFALWAGVILLLAMTAYSFSLHGSFLWDDDRHVEQNRGLRDADGLANIWTGHWRYLFATPEQRAQIRVYTPQYYPMTHTSYWMEYQFSGAQPNDINTTVFHIDNVILHVAGAILLWLVLRELAVPGAWLAAAIWALHPVNVESVAWISERKNVLAGAFYFGAMLAYVKWALRSEEESKDWTLPGVVIVLFTLAVLSKTVACSLPAVLLLIVWWKRGRITKRDLLITGPMFAIGIALGLVTAWAEKNYVRAEGPDYALSFVQRMLIAGNAVWFYLSKLLLPAKLTFIYPRWDVSAARPELWIGPIALVAVLGALFALRQKIGRGPLVAALIYVGVLLPALGFVNFYPMRYSFVADHFQYLAAAAMVTLLVAVGASIVRRMTAGAGARKETPYVIAGVVLVVLAFLTARQASIYASPIDLWRDTAAKNPNSWMAHNSYGYALLKGASELPPDRLDDRPGMLDEAEKQFEHTTQIKPDHIGAWKNWGEALLRGGKPKEAAEKFQQALNLSREDLDAWMGLGSAQFELQQYDPSLQSYGAAKDILEAMRPNAPRIKAAAVFESIARNLQAKGDLPAAAAAYQQSIDILPLPQTHYEFGQLLARQGNKPEAALQLGTAIRMQPDFIDARIELAKLMMDVGNLKGAHEQLLAAQRINNEYLPLLDAAKRWAVLMDEREKAATRPSATQSTTQPATAPSFPSPSGRG